ncbi:unnamed protein product [Albugo candida]|uniref:Uncharacterized protein n=1 Tax=Albugo candida TaxID=65357 RepID=A0A024GFC4_9STRA|nr:unnamed protein product [Albugo candida]|eukprot:CCI45243.1 unnamed protein product [Albugo candida]
MRICCSNKQRKGECCHLQLEIEAGRSMVVMEISHTLEHLLISVSNYAGCKFKRRKSQDYNLSCKSNSTETTIRYRYLLILFIILAKIKGHYLMGIGGLQAMITDSRLLPRLLACTTREISLTKCPTTKWIFFIPMEIVCVFPSYSFNGLGNCTLRSPSS